jgi:hypothetical protein
MKAVGDGVGSFVGSFVGNCVGSFVGDEVGLEVSLAVGLDVAPSFESHGVFGKQARPSGHSDEDPVGHGLTHFVDAS